MKLVLLLCLAGSISAYAASVECNQMIQRITEDSQNYASAKYRAEHEGHTEEEFRQLNRETITRYQAMDRSIVDAKLICR